MHPLFVQAVLEYLRSCESKWWGLGAKLGRPEQDAQFSSVESIFLLLPMRPPGWVGLLPPGEACRRAQSFPSLHKTGLIAYSVLATSPRFQAQGLQGSRDKRCWAHRINTLYLIYQVRGEGPGPLSRFQAHP